MPLAAPIACKKGLCPGKIINNICNRCGHNYKRIYNANRPGPIRGSSTERGYGAGWRRLRALVLAREPLCRECLKYNIIRPATEVHHILKKNTGGSNKFDNLEPLCKSCHSKKTRQGL
jgi:5-methylcytosine-specific restriction endonuclease McrA